MQPEHGYKLLYWPGIQGRGEFVRLAFEDAGVPYDDVGPRGGTDELTEILEPSLDTLTPFALPVLRHGDVVVAHTAAILQYIAPRIGVIPKDEAARLRAHQIQLTITDLCAEVHDTHHPVSVGLYYEDQKPEAARRAEAFVNERIPKFLRYFDRALEGNAWLVGAKCSYVDLSLFQVIAGLRYAFPRAMAKHERSHPTLTALHDAVEERPRIDAYLGSPRRHPFSQHDLFRHYPELDLKGDTGLPVATTKTANPNAKAAMATAKTRTAKAPAKKKSTVARATPKRGSRSPAGTSRAKRARR